jgi:hypothetical protein
MPHDHPASCPFLDLLLAVSHPSACPGYFPSDSPVGNKSVKLFLEGVKTCTNGISDEERVAFVLQHLDRKLSELLENEVKKPLLNATPSRTNSSTSSSRRFEWTWARLERALLWIEGAGTQVNSPAHSIIK